MNCLCVSVRQARRRGRKNKEEESKNERLPGRGSRQRPAAVHSDAPAVSCSSVTLRRAVATVCSAFWDETLLLPGWTQQRRSLTLTRLRTVCTHIQIKGFTIKTVFLIIITEITIKAGDQHIQNNHQLTWITLIISLQSVSTLLQESRTWWSIHVVRFPIRTLWCNDSAVSMFGCMYTHMQYISISYRWVVWASGFLWGQSSSGWSPTTEELSALHNRRNWIIKACGEKREEMWRCSTNTKQRDKRDK